MILQKVKEKEKTHETKCASCSGEINPYGTSNYTLLFGPEDFKKKASFCGVDCLEYFTDRLRSTKSFSTRMDPPQRPED